MGTDAMKKKILVVEDDDALRLLYNEELKREGYDIATAEDAVKALSYLKIEKPDLIILDIIMPGMTGMEAIGPILSEHRKVPIILNTSHPEYQDDFGSWGADAYVVKSSDLRELKQKVRELLEKGATR